MGVYDTVWVKCPKCGEENGFQSKSGDCSLRDFDLDNCPEDVMYNINRHSPMECDCGCKYQVNENTREVIIVNDDMV